MFLLANIHGDSTALNEKREQWFLQKQRYPRSRYLIIKIHAYELKQRRSPHSNLFNPSSSPLPLGIIWSFVTGWFIYLIYTWNKRWLPKAILFGCKIYDLVDARNLIISSYGLLALSRYGHVVQPNQWPAPGDFSRGFFILFFSNSNQWK